ncbi:MAG: hypothetical protein STSR0004_16230 [Peptococcaceae bacterium]
MQGEISLNEKELVISFRYDPELVTKVKKLPGRKYDPLTKSWTVPIKYYQNAVKMFPNFDISDNTKEIIEKLSKKEKEAVAMSTATDADLTVPGLRGELMPFQKAGVAYIEKTKGRVLLADEMGLGKTVQALAWLQLHPEIRPAVIICPASLKLNWQAEASKWLDASPENMTYVVKNSKDKIPEKVKIIIINYDLLTKRTEELSKLFPKALVLDESHYAKNNKAIRTKAVLNIGKQVENILCLSGTPFLNRPIEIWTTLTLLAPKLFPDWKSFVTRYCNGYRDKFGWNVSGASHMKELQKILRQNIMIRREKQQVLAELPEKRHTAITVEITNRKEYDQARSNFLFWLEKTFRDKTKIEAAQRAEVLTRMNTLRKLSAMGKIEAATEWVNNFLETGQKLVVFAHHKDVLDSVYSHFRDCAVKLTGETSTEERQGNVTKFQENSETLLFVAGIKAAGVGLTLTSASDVLFVEMDWTPAGNDQAEDRLHRIGQKNAVTVWHLVGYDTFDQDMYRTVVEKRQNFDAAFSLKKKKLAS